MKTAGYYDGVIVYDEVSSSFNYGDVYYINSPYSGVTKQDLPNVSTPYLAGRRKEVIVSSQEFNVGSWRLTCPVSTFHPGSTKLDGKKVLYKDHSGTTIVVHLEQLRARHIGDMLISTNSFQVGHLCDDFMKIITQKLLGFVDNEKERENLMTKEIKLEERLSAMDRRMDVLEDIVKRIGIPVPSSNAEQTIKLEEPIVIPTGSSLFKEFKGDIINTVPIIESDPDDAEDIAANDKSDLASENCAIDYFGLTVMDFVKEKIEFTDNTEDFINIHDIYDVYKAYCQDTDRHYISNISNFSKKMHQLYPDIQRDRRTLNKKSVSTWGPMKLKNSTTESAPQRKKVNRISKWNGNKIKLFEKDLKRLSVARVAVKYNVDSSTIYKYKKDHGI